MSESGSPFIYQNLQVRALARLRLQGLREERAQQRKADTQEAREERARVREATKNTVTWLQGYTKTFNPQWFEDGRDSPHEPFPDWGFFAPTLEIMEREPIVAIEKSRSMMVSWLTVGYFTMQAMMHPERQIVFQTMKEADAYVLLDYAKTLYDSQPDWLKQHFPLRKALSAQSKGELLFDHGGKVFAVAGGRDKVRSKHPWGYFSDEAGFQPEGMQCLDEALGAKCKKVVLVSTAAPGWYSEWRKA